VGLACLAMSSRGRRPPLNNSTSYVSPHPQAHKAARVLNTINEILAASAEIAEIIRIDETPRGNSCLPIATLDTVFSFSESLWEEIESLPRPLSTISTLHKPLMIYKLILIDIQHILSSSDPVEISDDAIDRRLDDFLLQFQEALDLLKCPTSQQNSPNPIHFFQNSHDINIYGGNFSVNNPVVYDPVVREQSRKTLQVTYTILYTVLFY